MKPNHKPYHLNEIGLKVISMEHWYRHIQRDDFQHNRHDIGAAAKQSRGCCCPTIPLNKKERRHQQADDNGRHQPVRRQRHCAQYRP